MNQIKDKIKAGAREYFITDEVQIDNDIFCIIVDEAGYGLVQYDPTTNDYYPVLPINYKSIVYNREKEAFVVEYNNNDIDLILVNKKG